MSRSIPTRILGGVLLAAVVLVAASCSGGGSTATSEPPVTSAGAAAEFSGYVRTPPLDVSDVVLPTVDGDRTPMVAEGDDGLLIVFFGYATCPDVCPLTLGLLRTAIEEQSPRDQERIRVAVVTVDPSRDTGELLGRYVAGYFPTGIALRTEDATLLRSAANEFGANYTSRENMDGKREIAHSAELYVVDHQGTVVLAWPYGTTPQAITADLKRLLAGERPTADD